MSEIPPRLLTTQLAAEYCGVSADLFERHFGAIIEPVRIGRRKMWDRRAIDRWLDERSGLAERGEFDWEGALNGDQGARR